MFIHLRYGAEIVEHVLEFQSGFATVVDVLRKAKKRYGKNPRLQLYNEYGKRMRLSDKVEKARSYRVKRY